MARLYYAANGTAFTYDGHSLPNATIDFSAPDGAFIELGVAEMREALRLYDAAMNPPPPPVVIPPPTEPAIPRVSEVYFGAPTRGFVVRNVFVGMTFNNPTGTALLGEVDGRYSGHVYVNCNFIGATYAAYLARQQGILFRNCIFTDRNQAPADESTVRLQSCRDIFFENCQIAAFGPKHAFRIHGDSEHIYTRGLSITSQGNGIMMGRHSPEAAANVRNVQMLETRMQCAGPDVLNIHRDGTVSGLNITDMTIMTPATWGVPRVEGMTRWVMNNIRRG